MPDHGASENDILLEIVRFLRAKLEQGAGDRRDAMLIAEVRKLTETIVSSSNGITIGIGDGKMNDYYQVGQAGAVGPNSIAIGQNFIQTGGEQAGGIDLSLLAQELQKVRDAAKASAAGAPDQDVVIGELASAQVAAEERNGPKTLDHLARAGSWALQVAKEIGVPIAVKAIEAAMKK